MDITSAQNPRVKHVVKLREDKRERQRERLMLVEGYDELTLALASGARPQSIYTAPELVTRQLSGLASDAITVNRTVFEKMSFRENPDGWLGVFEIPQRGLDELRLGRVPLILVAESVEKPGNLGAMLRTADAAGVDAILVADARVDLWNPNVVRASRGALFTVPAVEVDNAGALTWLRSSGVQILAATPAVDTTYTAADMRRPVALVVGTEDAGLSDFWLKAADVQVGIPMLGKVNSLNVSIAAALLVYEALRQRSGGSDPTQSP